MTVARGVRAIYSYEHQILIIDFSDSTFPEELICTIEMWGKS